MMLKIKGFILCVLSIFLLIVTNTVSAVDFGVKGNTHKIEEQPFLEMMQERLSKVDIAAKQEEMQNIAKERAKEPKPVENIEFATEDRVYFFDPSYVLEKDVFLPNGDLYYKKGTKVNPLKEMQNLQMSLDRRMIFIDSREEAQVEWLKDKLKYYVENKEEGLVENRIILVGGKPFELMEDIGVDIYFDQGGVITNRLGIKASPAIAKQDGDLLKIKEYAI